MTDLKQQLDELISTYHELNANEITEFEEEPSALEFMRYVSRNRPFVVRGGAQEWSAVRKWNLEYLNKVMAAQSVNVAMTPHGNADSVLQCDDEKTVFVKPHESEASFEDVSKYIADQEKHDGSGVVCYCQTQNDNLRNEYESLFKDVPRSIPFARIALEREPDAVNFWLGNSRSVTALHKDPYENVYVQIIGQKHFVLLPPVEFPCVNEETHPASTYQPVSEDGKSQFSDVYLQPVLDEPPQNIPFATWDPDEPDLRSNEFSALSRPLRISLQPGDMLYLPALWFHKVSQSCSEEGICCAVNYWYDMEYAGSFYTLHTFAKDVFSCAG